MSEYKFKQLSEIDTIEAPAEGTTVMGFENGKPIQMPMGSVKGTSGVIVIDPNGEDYRPTDTAYGDAIKAAIIGGQPVWYRNPKDDDYYFCTKFGFYNNCGQAILALTFTSELHANIFTSSEELE